MNRSLAKKPAAKKDLSASRSSKSTYSAKNLPKSRLNSLTGVTGSALSPDTIATRLSHLPPANRAPALRALQRTYGNQSVQRMAAGIQAKLRVGQPGDVYEQEADRVADEVMRMPEPQVQRQVEDEEEEEELLQPKFEESPDIIQRQVEPEEEEEELLQPKHGEGTTQSVTNDIESPIQAVRGGGQFMAESERAYFEPRFGYDFSKVQVHTGAQAAKSAQMLNARAYTLGRDVVFGAGEYAPETVAGRQLLAHELTHVVQQEHMRDSPNKSKVKSKSLGHIKENHSHIVMKNSKTKKASQTSPLSKLGGLLNSLLKWLQPTLGVSAVQWHNKIDNELKIKGNKYANSVVAGISQKALPFKYDDGVKIFLEDMQTELFKYAIGLIPYAGGVLSSVMGAADSAKKKIDAQNVEEAFQNFKSSLQDVMLTGIEEMVKSSSKFNDDVQSKIILNARLDPFFTKVPESSDDKIKYAEKMERFIEKEVNMSIFGNPAGSYKSILANVRSFINRSWNYFILARLEVEWAYKSCRWGLMKPDSACDKGYWSWVRYSKKCLHDKCKKHLFYSPMPPDWAGPKRQEHWGTCGGKFCAWFEVSTGVEHPSGVSSVPESKYEKEKGQYTR